MLIVRRFCMSDHPKLRSAILTTATVLVFIVCLFVWMHGCDLGSLWIEVPMLVCLLTMLPAWARRTSSLGEPLCPFWSGRECGIRIGDGIFVLASLGLLSPLAAIPQASRSQASAQPAGCSEPGDDASVNKGEPLAPGR